MSTKTKYRVSPSEKWVNKTHFGRINNTASAKPDNDATCLPLRDLHRLANPLDRRMLSDPMELCSKPWSNELPYDFDEVGFGEGGPGEEEDFGVCGEMRRGEEGGEGVEGLGAVGDGDERGRRVE